jgi:hypothetical protein
MSSLGPCHWHGLPTFHPSSVWTKGSDQLSAWGKAWTLKPGFKPQLCHFQLYDEDVTFFLCALVSVKNDSNTLDFLGVMGIR